MKKLLLTLLFLPFLASATTILPYNPPPTFFEKVTTCWLDIPCYFRQNLGSTITAITGSTQVSAFPTIYNTNNTNLNNGKVEVSDLGASTTMPQLTTLANLSTVGTITSGVWSGTAVLPAKGGTGSTTLSANQVLLGNGTGNIGVVAGWGSSGQFLTSGGGTAVPTWTTGSLDQTGNFNFTGTYFNVKNFNASSTVANPMVLNGINTVWPSANSAGFLSNNGSGTYSISTSYNKQFFVSTSTISATQTSSTTVMLTTIPANTLNGQNDLQCDFIGNNVPDLKNTEELFIEVNYGTATTTIRFTQSSGSEKSNQRAQLNLLAGGANNQNMYFEAWGGTNIVAMSGSGTFTQNSTQALQLMIVAKTGSGSSYFAPTAIICSLIR